MPTYSHSRISAFEQCRLKYYYQYIDKPDLGEVLGDNIAAFLGKQVHITLEKLYKDLMMTKKDSLDDLLAFYSKEWEKNWEEDIIIPAYSEKEWRALGEKYITDYYKTYSPFNQDRTIGLERRIVVKIGDYTLQGYIDRISETKKGHYQIRDYKTIKNIQPQDKYDADRQLALYQIGIEQMFDDVKDITLIWHMLHFNKEIQSKRTPEQLKKLREETGARIAEIESCKDYPPTETQLCEWCSFQTVCPKKNHEYLTDKLTVREFQKDEGVKLANDFVHTYRKVKEWEEKNDQIKTAVLAYSEQHKTTKIVGSNAAVGIYDKKTPKYDEAAEELIKKAGLWEQYSKLDGWKLSKEAPMLDDKLKKALEKHEEVGVSRYARVLKKEGEE